MNEQEKYQNQRMDDSEILSTEVLFQHEPYFYYALLNVPITASPTMIAKGFRRQSRMYHTDMHVHTDTDSPAPTDTLHLIERAMHIRFQQINEAYRVLQDTTEKRVLYDAVCAMLAQQRRRSGVVDDKTIQEMMEELTNQSLHALSSVPLEGEALRLFLQESFARRDVIRLRSAMSSPVLMVVGMEKLFSFRKILRGLQAIRSYVCFSKRPGAQVSKLAHDFHDGACHSLLALLAVNSLQISSEFRTKTTGGSSYCLHGRSRIARNSLKLTSAKNGKLDWWQFRPCEAKLKLTKKSWNSPSESSVSFSPFSESVEDLMESASKYKRPYFFKMAHTFQPYQFNGSCAQQTIALCMKPAQNLLDDALIQVCDSNSAQNLRFESLGNFFEAAWKLKCRFSLTKHSFTQLKWVVAVNFASLYEHFRKYQKKTPYGLLAETVFALINLLRSRIEIDHTNYRKQFVETSRLKHLYSASVGLGSLCLGFHRQRSHCAPLLGNLLKNKIPFGLFDCSFIPNQLRRSLPEEAEYVRFEKSNIDHEEEKIFSESPMQQSKNETDSSSDEASVFSDDTIDETELRTSFHPTACHFETSPPMHYLPADSYISGNVEPSGRSFSLESHQFSARRQFGYGEFFAPVYRVANEAVQRDDVHPVETHEDFSSHATTSISASYGAFMDFFRGGLSLSQEYTLQRWFPLWDVGINLRLTLPVISYLAVAILRKVNVLSDEQIESTSVLSELLEESSKIRSSFFHSVLLRSLRSAASLMLLFDVNFFFRQRIQSESQEDVPSEVRIPILISANICSPMKIYPFLLSCSESIGKYVVMPYMLIQTAFACILPTAISAWNAIRCARYLQKHRTTILKHREYAVKQQQILFDAVGAKTLARENSVLLPAAAHGQAFCGGLIIQRAVYRARPRNPLLKWLLTSNKSRTTLKKGSKSTSDSHFIPMALDVTSVLQSLVEKSKLVVHTTSCTQSGLLVRRYLFQIVPGMYDIEPTGSEQKELVIDYLFLGRKHRCLYIDGPSGDSEDMICIPQEAHLRR